MKKIVVCVRSNGKFIVGPNGMVALKEEKFKFDWATHDCVANEKLLSVKEGDYTVLIVPLERLNYLRVVDVPEEEEDDATN